MPLHLTDCLFINDIPRECIEDCSRPGKADDAVEHWRTELEFTVDRAKAIDCLQGYGAWTAEELATSSDDELAARILWLACGDFSEFITYAEDAGVDPFGERADSFDPPAGSDIFALE